jgi:hypothetical protein
MRPTRLWPLVAVIILALPAAALADARDYPGRLGDGPRVNRNSGRFDGARFDGRRFDGHRFDGRRFDGHRRPGTVIVVPSNIIVVGPSEAYAAPPPVTYAPPPPAYYYAPPPMYGPSPAYYSPPPAAYAPPPPASPPPPPSEPRVVEFDSGRYELRGDGVREPYTWVWVPRAPTAPPGQASAPRRPATVYRWTDERGVTTLTDDPNKVPAQFRALEITPRP